MKSYAFMLALFCSCSLLSGQIKLEEAAKNFRLPFFGENNVRHWELQGESGSLLRNEAVLITAMRLRVFDPTDGLTLRTTIVSPLATVFPNETQAEGPDQVVVDGINFRLQGEDWHWDGRRDFLQIRKKAHVTFYETVDLLLR